MSKQRQKPHKPYRLFPLTAHNNGQWCKKIRGKVHFFGVWANPQAALDRYLQIAADIHAGRQPQATISKDAITVKDVCNYYLNYQLQKVEAGQIHASSFDDCRTIAECFAHFVGPTRIVSDLSAADFQRFRVRVSKYGVSNRSKGLGIHAQSRTITIVKSIFKFAYDSDYLDRPMKFGTAFIKPSATLTRKSRHAIELENGKRLFEPAQILALLEEADIILKTMILLGINGGMGNTDCARLPIKAVNLEKAMIEFDRPKTGIERVVPLWPETVGAIRSALAHRAKPADNETEKLVFLTTFGKPWVRENIHRTEDSGISKVVPIDAIGQEFDKLLKKLGIKRKGLGFYALRHTFRTWADEVQDQHAIHRIMGHSIPGMSGIYVEKIELNRLRAVADHVRKKLFSEPIAVSHESEK